jgi:hypothetical protein
MPAYVSVRQRTSADVSGYPCQLVRSRLRVAQQLHSRLQRRHALPQRPFKRRDARPVRLVKALFRLYQGAIRAGLSLWFGSGKALLRLC